MPFLPYAYARYHQDKLYAYATIMEYIEKDEYLEVTPKAIRMRSAT